MKLNERIKACRVRAGLTQEQVAEAMDVTRQAVTKWENGQSAPSTENLFKLAELFGTTVDLILKEEKPQPDEKRAFQILQDKNFWISFIAGLVIFLVINPYGHDIYIPVLFTLVCIFLNLYSVFVFSVLLYKLLSRREIGEDFGMYFGLLIFGTAGHVIFSCMYWGSWVCLGLSVLCIVWLAVKRWLENQKNDENNT